VNVLRATAGAPLRLPRPTARVQAAVAAVLLGVWVVVMQVRLTGYALADIMGALGASPDEAAWLNTGYTVAELLAIPLAGALTRRLSARRVFVPAALVFAFASLAAITVNNLGELILLRIAQGFAGGMFIPLATPTFQRKLPFRHRLTAFTLYGIASSAPIAVAPLLESYLVDDLSWRLVFLPPALLSLIAAALGAWGMPVVPLQRAALRLRVDWGGTVLLPLGLGLIVLGIDQANRLDWFGSDWVVGTTLGGSLTLLAFALHERTRARPTFPPALWRKRNFAIGLLTFLLFRASMIAVVWAIPDFLQRVERFRPSDFGDFFMAMVLPQLIVPFLVVRLSRRVDLRLVIASGIMCQAIACLRTATLNNDWNAPEFIPLFFLHGLGQALFFTPILVLLTLNLSDEERPGSVALVNLTRVFGQAVGVSVASTLVTKGEHLHHNMLDEYLHIGGIGAESRLGVLREIVTTHTGYDGEGLRGLALAGAALRNEAFTLAYADLFLGIGVLLLGVLLLQMWLAPMSLRELDPRSAWRTMRSSLLTPAHESHSEPAPASADIPFESPATKPS